MKKQLGLLSISMLMSLCALAGCNKDNRKAVTMWATFNVNYQAILEKAFKNFEANNPGWRVDYVKQTGSYNDLKKKVVEGVPAGNYPDIVVAYPDSVADFIYTGKALDIAPYMNNEEYGWAKEDFDDIPEAYITEGQQYMIPGTYSLPICKSTEAMYYNKAIIGVDLSEIDPEVNDGEAIDEEYINNLTWDELLDHLAPALIEYNEELAGEQKIIKTSTLKDKDSWAVVGYDSDDNLFITLAEQYGYGYTSINEQTGAGNIDFVNDGMKGLMTKLNGAYKEHLFTTSNILGDRCNNIFTQSGMIFSIGSTGGVSYQFSESAPMDVGVARLPQATHEEEDWAVINQGPSLAFMRRDKEKELYAEMTWKLYKEITEPAIATQWAIDTGYTPIRRSTADTKEYMDLMNENAKKLKTFDRLKARNAKYAIGIGDYLFSNVVYLGSSKAREAVGKLAGEVIKEENLTPAKLNESFENARKAAI